MRLLDHVIFNVIACNTDAHAKNYSMMISGLGVGLAPLYDVLCADAWQGIAQNLAQRIGGKNRGAHLKKRHWERMALECGLRADGVVARVRSLAERARLELPAALSSVEAMPAGSHALLPQFSAAIEQRARTLILGLDEAPSASTGGAKASTPSKKTRAKGPSA